MILRLPTEGPWLAVALNTMTKIATKPKELLFLIFGSEFILSEIAVVWAIK